MQRGTKYWLAVSAVSFACFMSGVAEADQSSRVTSTASSNHPDHAHPQLAGGASSPDAMPGRRVRRVVSSHIPAETTSGAVPPPAVAVVHITGQGGGGVMQPPPRRRR